jgi:hypothetical protein
MRPTQSLGFATKLLALGFTLVAFNAATRAQTPTRATLAGQYACAEARVGGKAVPCKAAPLSLKTDGRFELQGREGEYLINGKWVELDGVAIKSRASIEPGHKIVFRFYTRKGLCEIIYERRLAELGKTHLG